MSSSALPPMGWYADPGGSSQERYWDGASWTANLRDPEPASRSSAAASDQVPSRGTTGPVQTSPSGTEPAAPAAASTGRQSRTADGVPLAGWWWRVLATVIDQILIGLLAVVPAWRWIQQLQVGYTQIFEDAMEAARLGTPAPTTSAYAHLTAPMSYLQLTVIGVGAAYLLISYLAVGRTVGNMATGTWVVRVDQGNQRGRLSPITAIGRTMAISAILVMNLILPVLWLIDVFAALATRRRQTLHDLIAGTQVVRPRSTTWRA